MRPGRLLSLCTRRSIGIGRSRLRVQTRLRLKHFSDPSSHSFSIPATSPFILPLFLPVIHGSEMGQTCRRKQNQKRVFVLCHCRSERRGRWSRRRLLSNEECHGQAMKERVVRIHKSRSVGTEITPTTLVSSKRRSLLQIHCFLLSNDIVV